MSEPFDWQNAMIDLTAERDRLKAELENRTQSVADRQRENDIRIGDNWAMMHERDLWKSKAMKLAGALRKMMEDSEGMRGEYSDLNDAMEISEEALAEYSHAGGVEKGNDKLAEDFNRFNPSFDEKGFK